MRKFVLAFLMAATAAASPARADVSEDLQEFADTFRGKPGTYKVDFLVYHDQLSLSDYGKANWRTVQILEKFNYVSSFKINENYCRKNKLECMAGITRFGQAYRPDTDIGLEFMRNNSDSFNEEEWRKFIESSVSKQVSSANYTYSVYYSVGTISSTNILSFSVEPGENCDYKLLLRHILESKSEVGEVVLEKRNSFKQWMCVIKSAEGFEIMSFWNAY